MRAKDREISQLNEKITKMMTQMTVMMQMMQRTTIACLKKFAEKNYHKLFEKSKHCNLMPNKYHKFQYISPVYWVNNLVFSLTPYYKGREKLSRLYIDHITDLVVIQTTFYYDQSLNPRTGPFWLIRALYSDTKEAFDSDIRKWKVSTITSVPKQTNSIDCAMYVCKYMERINLEGNTK
ncbi:hypothetical protein IEQ34_007344 [Dendrobium chrysotoxum]|uniref:Ubiquitin-like protease family profile domain-containing protein n=1 Tax=Dendrobium chrysotoxum TaxID=161865 RepID=A0AAV7HAF9_DENCH|nr:hypothetical protein IEQ34_007344 [Dendrobium chrysotoxum]